ncbi:hypothetical protein [Terrisporobacter mayombei]|uniref:Uncharacterized protein n=1 Tax=Terrisporobacter mayombei TaxID=1541 RepID=A0ABY9PZF9_9FIRM|nr:hypothetical protein [Terrisporobacter mayombei]MCC3866869.1 hypothetical protein [Terrisporobacter mayombei]WMT81110.1 hypothetical protein TEMA_14420 [Terrisporobacter mayombei]
MKKIISLTLCFTLIFTHISYCQTNNISDAIKDLKIVGNKINIMIDEISGDEPLDMSKFKEDVKYCESILASRSNKISKDYSNESDIELKAAYSSLLYVSSLYALSLNSIIVYIHNNSKSHYFIDICTTYRNGTLALDAIKSNF